MATGQRFYAPNSILATGNWYKISILESGVYKVEVPFLNSLGISGSIPSDQLRIFTRLDGMLPESNAVTRIDDLKEIAIDVEDGGDGVLNGQDYILFYAAGPDYWLKDSSNKRFIHQKNLYSDKVYLYITIGGNGLRIPSLLFNTPPSLTVTSYDERFAHELDSVNFLTSGKEWFGEEISNIPGRKSTQEFSLPYNDFSGPATIISNVAARSINVAANLSVTIGGQAIQQLSIPATSNGLYDLFAQEKQKQDQFVITPGTSTIAFNYLQGSANSQCWINWFEFFARRNLSFVQGKQLTFRDWTSVGTTSIQFIINNATQNCSVWDITDAYNVKKIPTTITGNEINFNNDGQTLHEYICFSNYLQPSIVGKVANQNLHNSTESDLIIITYPGFLTQANRIAAYHQQNDHLKVVTVTTDQIFNEFSAGIPDPTAIRDFVKMYYDKYKGNWNQSGKYLLLFGKG
ncbi:MAG TPA: C25 family cysteine peptidase, partial [Flavisolibacter sp.]|nr:C25 family cysteine peptidase [Flavisolibacter sp.]